MHFTYNEADPIGLIALVEASAIHSSIRIVSNDVTTTPAQSGKKKTSKPESWSVTGQHKLVQHLGGGWGWRGGSEGECRKINSHTNGETVQLKCSLRK